MPSLDTPVPVWGWVLTTVNPYYLPDRTLEKEMNELVKHPVVTWKDFQARAQMISKIVATVEQLHKTITDKTSEHTDVTWWCNPDLLIVLRQIQDKHVLKKISSHA
jgi:hypothetical protein